MKNNIISLLFISIGTLLYGCTTTDSDPQTYDFGADYIVITESEFPAIIDGELHVEVFYNACEPNHVFNLAYEEIEENSYEVWLMKITPNQDCEEPFEEMQIFILPDELQAGRFVYVGPNVHVELRSN